MAIKRIETKLGSALWEMNTLPATTGLQCMTQLAAIVGAPAGAAAGGIKTKDAGGVMDLKAEAVGEAIAKMTARIAEPATVQLIETLLPDLRRNDEKIVFDDYFAANYGELTSLLIWSVKENFGSFLAGNPLLAKLAGKAQQLIQAS